MLYNPHNEFGLDIPDSKEVSESMRTMWSAKSDTLRDRLMYTILHKQALYAI